MSAGINTARPPSNQQGVAAVLISLPGDYAPRHLRAYLPHGPAGRAVGLFHSGLTRAANFVTGRFQLGGDTTREGAQPNEGVRGLSSHSFDYGDSRDQEVGQAFQGCGSAD